MLPLDKAIRLTVDQYIQLLVTAADVLHSVGVPSCALKIDACPGRLNSANFYVNREGVLYGQCSEICGVGHSFMPLVIEVGSDAFL